MKDKKKMKEFVIRLIYVEMLGQDASFAYIKAVELCASTSIIQKKAGYLAASLCLSPEHEFRFMLVNQIQRDMGSSNVLEICTALTAVNKLVTVDMIPAVIGEVGNRDGFVIDSCQYLLVGNDYSHWNITVYIIRGICIIMYSLIRFHCYH